MSCGKDGRISGPSRPIYPKINMKQVVILKNGLTLTQDDAYFKLTQDTALLSAFALVRRGERALDLGCGCGALGVLLLGASSDAVCDGVELSCGAAALARENYASCGFATRGEIFTADLREKNVFACGAYDVCISNPPYFTAAEGALSPRADLAAARGDAAATLDDVCRAAARALRWGGRFYLCYPPRRVEYLHACLAKAGFHVKALRFVHQRPGAAAQLVLCEARTGGGEGCEVGAPFWVEAADGGKSDEYQACFHWNSR